MNRQINMLILQKNTKSVEITTKLLALVYCALAESIFSKLIHTPNGLTLSEIEQVKSELKSHGVKAGWMKCAELSVRYVEGLKSGHSQNVSKKICELIDKFVFDPSLIRNKLAHGQWVVALNRENTAINNKATQEIEELDVVELYRRKYALERLSLIVEDVIESPNKAHHRDYWKHIAELEEKQKEMAGWTYEKKERQLLLKRSHTH